MDQNIDYSRYELSFGHQRWIEGIGISNFVMYHFFGGYSNVYCHLTQLKLVCLKPINELTDDDAFHVCLLYLLLFSFSGCEDKLGVDSRLL